MIGSFSFTEIAFIVILALVIFGPKRLPEIGRMVGRGLGEFRKVSNELRRTFNTEMSLEEDEPKTPMRRAPRLSDPVSIEPPETASAVSPPSPEGGNSEADGEGPAAVTPAGVIAQGSDPVPEGVSGEKLQPPVPTAASPED